MADEKKRRKKRPKYSTKSRSSKKIPPAVWLSTDLDAKTGQYSDFEIKKNSLGISGLFARHDLQPNSRFFYYGSRITAQQYKTIVARAKKDGDISRVSYIIDCPGKLTCLVDAFPGLAPASNGVGGHGSYVGGKINEPAPGQKENAWFTGFRDPKDGKMWPAVILVSKVKKGQELLAHYGPDYDRHYKVGLPRKTEPDWWKHLE